MLIGLYNRFAAITPSDTVDIGELTDGLMAGVTGNVVVVEQNGNATTIKGMTAGQVYPFKIRRVNATSTTATDLVALYAT